MIDQKMITTAFELPNYSIEKSLGIVRGISVRSLNFFSDFKAGFQTLFGGNIKNYSKLCEQTRLEAFDLMKRQATELGANAIICMRYDANEINSGVTEILAYGTAVIVKESR